MQIVKLTSRHCSVHYFIAFLLFGVSRNFFLRGPDACFRRRIAWQATLISHRLLAAGLLLVWLRFAVVLLLFRRLFAGSRTALPLRLGIRFCRAAIGFQLVRFPGAPAPGLLAAPGCPPAAGLPLSGAIATGCGGFAANSSGTGPCAVSAISTSPSDQDHSRARRAPRCASFSGALCPQECPHRAHRDEHRQDEIEDDFQRIGGPFFIGGKKSVHIRGLPRLSAELSPKPLCARW